MSISLHDQLAAFIKEPFVKPSTNMEANVKVLTEFIKANPGVTRKQMAAHFKNDPGTIKKWLDESLLQGVWRDNSFPHKHYHIDSRSPH